METKVIKFNIRSFIEEFSIAKESSDLDYEEELVDRLTSFYNLSSDNIKKGILSYIKKDVIASQYPDLQNIISKNRVIF